MTKTRASIIFLCGAAVGVAATVFVMQGRSAGGDLAADIDPSRTPQTTVSPKASDALPQQWEKMARDAALSSVAVQSIQAGKVIRSGSGIVLSSDGFILTTADSTPAGRYTYQVLSGTTVERATLVTSNISDNLALLKIGLSGLTVSRLDSDIDVISGQELILTGKLVQPAEVVTFTQRALLNYSAGKTILIDTLLNTFLSGAKVIDHAGNVIGMAYLRNGKTYLIPAQILENFWKGYFDTVR